MKRLLCFAVATLLVLSMTACQKTEPPASSSSDTAQTSSAPSKPATWIADRHIKVRTFDGDIGDCIPKDQMNNEVAQKIKELTGITMEVEYTSGASSFESLTTAIAAGNLPDAIVYYLNNSTRKEFPVVLKAAKEGILADIAPYLKQTKVYSKYYQKGYLPDDTYNNIIQRPEFNGATYHVHRRINRTEDVKYNDIRGGMYIQKTIVDKLKINPWEINTTEKLYDLLVKIKNAGLKDSFGNPITPLGPSYWGGGSNVRQYVFQEFLIGNSTWEYTDGKVTHQVQTDSLTKQIDFARKLLKESLMHKEFFTMDETRAIEGANSYSFGVIEDVHSGVTDLFDKYEYLPLGPIVDKYGRNYKYESGKSGYGAWSVPKSTKNPEEIVKFADFMASKEGKILWQYGIEGKHYDLKDGKPIVKKEMLDLMKNDPTALVNLNIWAGGVGSAWGEIFGRTDMDTYTDFGEVSYGESADPNRNAKGKELVNYGLDKRPYDKTVKTKGFSPAYYLTTFPRTQELEPLIKSSKYNDTVIQAIYAKTDAESKKIIETYREQLKKAGLEEFCTFLADIIKKSPEMVDIRSKAE